jgi:transposase
LWTVVDEAEVTAGQAHESSTLTAVLENARIPGDGERDVAPVPLGGDKAFDAPWIGDWLEERAITPGIPHRGEMPEARHPDFDRELYRRRNVIERLVGRLKECRRLFARYEKTELRRLH